MGDDRDLGTRIPEAAGQGVGDRGRPIAVGQESGLLPGLHPEDFFHDSSSRGHEIYDAAHVGSPVITTVKVQVKVNGFYWDTNEHRSTQILANNKKTKDLMGRG